MTHPGRAEPRGGLNQERGMEEGAPEPPSPRRRLVALLLAASAALIGWQLAPEPWPTGAGRLELVHRGATIAAADVTVGSADPAVFPLELENLSTAATLELPSGVRVDAPLNAQLTLPDLGSSVEAEEIVFRLVLPDGRAEPLPTRLEERDEGPIRVVATRRPPVASPAVLALLGAVVVLWVTEAFPLFVTSLAIPVVLVALGVGGARESLAPFFDPVIVLFFAGFLMAEAMRRIRLDRLAAISIVAAAARSPVTLFGTMLGVSAFLSMWMSNTAAVAVLVPIALAVTAPLGSAGYRRAIVLGIAYAATVGGVGSLIGTPANPIARTYLRSYVGHDISFLDWFAIGLPMVFVFLPLLGAYLWLRMRASPDGRNFAEARRVARLELTEVGRLSREQWTVLAVFVAVLIGWLTEELHGLDTAVVALGGAVALAALGRIRPDDLGRIGWPALLTFGGGLTLGFFLVETGTSDWLATRLEVLAFVPAPLAIAGVAAFTLALTAVASNTASAAIVIPLAISLAAIVRVDPVVLVLVVAVASSIDFALVIGTPPTLLAYSTGLFSPGQIFRIGIILDVAGVLVLVTVVTWIWSLLGVV